jgi:hypothetical protein
LRVASTLRLPHRRQRRRLAKVAIGVFGPIEKRESASRVSAAGCLHVRLPPRHLAHGARAKLGHSLSRLSSGFASARYSLGRGLGADCTGHRRDAGRATNRAFGIWPLAQSNGVLSAAVCELRAFGRGAHTLSICEPILDEGGRVEQVVNDLFRDVSRRGPWAAPLCAG